MPIYEYCCNQCCNEFETLVLSADDEAPACPACQSRDVVKLMSAGSFRPQGVPSGSGGFKAPACAPSRG